MSRVYEGLYKAQITLDNGVIIESKEMSYEECQIYLHIWGGADIFGHRVAKGKIVQTTKRNWLKWLKLF